MEVFLSAVSPFSPYPLPVSVNEREGVWFVFVCLCVGE